MESFPGWAYDTLLRHWATDAGGSTWVHAQLKYPRQGTSTRTGAALTRAAAAKPPIPRMPVMRLDFAAEAMYTCMYTSRYQVPPLHLQAYMYSYSCSPCISFRRPHAYLYLLVPTLLHVYCRLIERLTNRRTNRQLVCYQTLHPPKHIQREDLLVQQLRRSSTLAKLTDSCVVALAKFQRERDELFP